MSSWLDHNYKKLVISTRVLVVVITYHLQQTTTWDIRIVAGHDHHWRSINWPPWTLTMLHILTHPLLCGHMQISLSSCPYQYTWQIWAVFEPPSPCSREEGRWGQAERQLESGQFQLFPFECCWRWLGANRVRGLGKGRRWCWQGESSVLARCYRGGYVPTLLQSGFNVESHRDRLLGGGKYYKRGLCNKKRNPVNNKMYLWGFTEKTIKWRLSGRDSNQHWLGGHWIFPHGSYSHVVPSLVCIRPLLVELTK